MKPLTLSFGVGMVFGAGAVVALAILLATQIENEL